MVAKNKTLIITICSNTKTREDETRAYEDQGSFANYLSPSRSALLYRSRDRVRKLITGSARVAGTSRLLRDRPYNDMLSDGPDFHPDAPGKGYYLAAAKRYRGRFYQNLGPGGANLLLQTSYHVLILSGLYGLVTPADSIQCYSCNVNEHPTIVKTWTEGDRLTSLLIDYITRNGITRVIEMTAVLAYRQLIAWGSVRSAVREQLFHCFGRQLQGDALLSPLGSLARRLLSGKTSQLDGLSHRTVASVPRYEERVYFLPLPYPTNSGIAIEAWGDPTLQTLHVTRKDAIARMRRNIVLVLGHQLQIRDQFVEYADRVRRAEERGIINPDLAQTLRSFGRIRNRVEYCSGIVSDREWKAVLSYYEAFKQWISWNRYDEHMELDVV